jgi:hypothetical protein
MKMSRFDKQLSIKVLIIYMISTLLFLTSIELHIHTQETAALETAALEGHGAAVSISSLSSELMPPGTGDEIKVSPDGVLKLQQNSFSFPAIFLLVALVAAITCYSFFTRLRVLNSQLPNTPFHGAPLLRAPPL